MEQSLPRAKTFFTYTFWGKIAPGTISDDNIGWRSGSDYNTREMRGGLWKWNVGKLKVGK